jgi:hypothetical protein
MNLSIRGICVYNLNWFRYKLNLRIQALTAHLEFTTEKVNPCDQLSIIKDSGAVVSHFGL